MTQSEITLPTARVTDPITSHLAARSASDITLKQKLVWECLARSAGHTLEELVDHYQGNTAFPKQSESGIRTRCAELVKLGWVEDSLVRRKTPNAEVIIASLRRVFELYSFETLCSPVSDKDAKDRDRMDAAGE